VSFDASNKQTIKATPAGRGSTINLLMDHAPFTPVVVLAL